jgi:hypothetical protein
VRDGFSGEQRDLVDDHPLLPVTVAALMPSDPESRQSKIQQPLPFGSTMRGKPGLKHHCATNRCFATLE